MSDKRTAILAATLKLVSENGFHGTSMSQIAKEAGVSAGIIYHYFDNKDALMSDLYRDVKYRLSQAMLVGYAEDLPLHERFQRLWRNVLAFFMHHPHETAFMEQYANSPYLTPELEAAYNKYFQPVKTFMVYAIEQGVIKPMPEEMLLVFTFDVAIALAKRHHTGLLTLDEVNLDRAVKACWDAIKQ